MSSREPIAELLGVPAEPVQDIIDACLEKDKSKRIQSANELLDALRKGHQWYLENQMLQATGLEKDPQSNISTFRMASDSFCRQTQNRYTSPSSFSY